MCSFEIIFILILRPLLWWFFELENSLYVVIHHSVIHSFVCYKDEFSVFSQILFRICENWSSQDGIVSLMWSILSWNITGAQACVLVFSTTDRESFEAISSWREKVVAEVGEIPTVLVQNKIDLLDDSCIKK